jgi:hypothetical protein
MDHGTTASSRSMVDLRPWCGAAAPGSRGRRDSSERERGVRRGSHQWHHMEAKLWRWPHDGAQQRQPVVPHWGDGSGREEERLEPGWVRWIMVVLSSCLLKGHRTAEGGCLRGGRKRWWNFNAAGYGR